MSNEMTLNFDNLPAHLRQTDTGADEFGAGIQSGGLDAPILSIRGKEFRFRFQGNETSTRSREIKVVLLRSRPHLSKRWYKGQYESGSVDMPACFSIDGVRPEESSPDKQSDLCSRCPRNQWGSKITPAGKKGKECADYKRMLVLPVLEGRLTDQPVVFDVPATSLRKAKADRSDNMFLQEYTGVLARHKVPVPGLITVLEFTDAEYPQVAFRMDRPVTEDEWAQVQALREDEETVALLEEPHAEQPGPITEKAPEPAFEPAKAAPAEDNGESGVADLLGGRSKPEPDEQETTPPPEPKPTKQEAAPEPEPEPNDTASDDVMNDVKKLLGGL